MPSVGYSEQTRAIETGPSLALVCSFLSFKLSVEIKIDVLVSLPTGYGKSLCFALLPLQ